ncbi:DUF418 domain-containing protein [Sphingomonas sp. S2-65]|uniref:DUF418 domain-containing protein n=1 Tax=Sphingomonas sp. S2-65 TaxID=2903960 RepID=UPI001F163C3E|nr:DUF418 domain-containing protein [Sphingomonas sp. S2-65]UYY58758.1 DUF418 domain-containing protein [Sphingomonas sp. S2-65]
MTNVGELELAPTGGGARIDLLDMLRGIAILGILYINVPYMAAPVWQFTSGDMRGIGWGATDEAAWAGVELLLAGTMRCLLEFLFGAGMMLMARKAMAPDGPVAVSDLYYRRNLWLLGFGLIDVFVLLWPGDILHIYALAALFLFPFRRLAAKWLVAIGLVWPLLFAIGIPDNGVRGYLDRATLTAQVEAARRHAAGGAALTAPEVAAVQRWRMLERRGHDPQTLRHEAEERQAHSGPVAAYLKRAWGLWSLWTQQWLVWNVVEAFCTMSIGVALWKWGVIQGARGRRFYLALMVVGYGFGLTARGFGLAEMLDPQPVARSIWITGEAARLSMGLGHVALINLLVRDRWGARLLNPFKAAGRMAFSLYFLQQLVGMWLLFAPWGLVAWGRLGWGAMAGVATAMAAGELVLAALWLRYFTSGPLEWLWRSLAYLRVQPLLRKAG